MGKDCNIKLGPGTVITHVRVMTGEVSVFKSANIGSFETFGDAVANIIGSDDKAVLKKADDKAVVEAAKEPTLQDLQNYINNLPNRMLLLWETKHTYSSLTALRRHRRLIKKLQNIVLYNLLPPKF